MSRGSPAPGVVYALSYRTWSDGMGVGYAFSPERMAMRLRDDQTLPSVVLVDPVRSRLSGLRAARRQAPEYSTDPTRRHLRLHRWRSAEPFEVYEAVRLQRWVHSRLVRTVDPASTVLVTSHPVLAAVADTTVWRDVAFYAWDDFRGLPDSVALVDWAYAEIARRDVNVVAVTESILRLVGAARSTVVPNGVDSDDFEALGRVPGWFAAFGGPVALYVGSLQDRVDVETLCRLADDLPSSWTVALVGPMQEPSWFEALSRRANVVIAPAVSRPVALAMMATATVCLVPHLPQADRMSPLKVYEYLGSGTPVVASDLEPMRGISPRCHLVAAGDDWCRAVLAAASESRAGVDEVAAFRSAHDWDRRYLDFRRVVLGSSKAPSTKPVIRSAKTVDE